MSCPRTTNRRVRDLVGVQQWNKHPRESMQCSCKNRKEPRRFFSSSGIQETSAFVEAQLGEHAKNWKFNISFTFHALRPYVPYTAHFMASLSVKHFQLLTEHWFAKSKEAASEGSVSWMHAVETKHSITCLYHPPGRLNRRVERGVGSASFTFTATHKKNAARNGCIIDRLSFPAIKGRNCIRGCLRFSPVTPPTHFSPLQSYNSTCSIKKHKEWQPQCYVGNLNKQPAWAKVHLTHPKRRAAGCKYRLAVVLMHLCSAVFDTVWANPFSHVHG